MKVSQFLYFRGACMSSSSSTTTRPAGCVSSSWPSLRPSASPGSTVRQCLTQRANIVSVFCGVKGGWLETHI